MCDPRSTLDLKESAKAAVENRLAAAEKTKALAKDLIGKIEEIAQEQARECEILAGVSEATTKDDRYKTETVQNLLTIVADFNARTQSVFTRQLEVLSTFNIALFGRTGSGKSSLIEAITCGDGESVSQGESDWTTEVRPREWEGCKIYDTPGINGWGRTQDRYELEQKAREAVEVADFVLDLLPEPGDDGSPSPYAAACAVPADPGEEFPRSVASKLRSTLVAMSPCCVCTGEATGSAPPPESSAASAQTSERSHVTES